MALTDEEVNNIEILLAEYQHKYRHSWINHEIVELLRLVRGKNSVLSPRAKQRIRHLLSAIRHWIAWRDHHPEDIADANAIIALCLHYLRHHCNYRPRL